MPRQPRIALGDTIYHVLNRAHNRESIFRTEKDYQHFESLFEESKELVDMSILSAFLSKKVHRMEGRNG